MQNSNLSSPSPRVPTFAHLFRRLFSWRMLRVVVVVLAALLTLAALFYAEENWRGKHAWENYKQELEAKGVQLNLRAFVPPTVPDDQNFAMTPFLAPLYDYLPGTQTHRDTNAFSRSMNFAQKAGVSAKAGWPEGARIDLADWLAVLETNSPAAQRRHDANDDIDRRKAAAGITAGLQKYSPVLDELRASSHRPHSRFNIRYDEENPWAILVPHLPMLRTIGHLLEARASAELALGNADAAFNDVELILFLTRSIQDEPLEISQLIRIAILRENALQIVWEGLADRRWSEVQLLDFQAQLQRLTILKDVNRALQAERAAGNETCELLRTSADADRIFTSLFGDGPAFGFFYLRLGPHAWMYREQINYNRFFDEEILPGFDSAAEQVHPRIIEDHAREMERMDAPVDVRFVNHRLIASLLLPASIQVTRKPAFTQTGINEALIACALERHRQANGQFPETLDALMPKFVEKLPLDIIGGQPLKYHRTDDGQFVLYSVGWNEKDDGGRVVEKGHRMDVAQGDWVWKYPSK
jgi:hypothetical protein